jgi:hypothetical protein
MTTAYTSLLGLALPVTGELSGTWGDTVNNSITSLVDTAVAGTTNVSADSNVTLTTTTGASNQARQAILLFSGARTAIRTVTAPAQSKIYTVINATTGGFAVTLVGAGPTTGVTIVAGESAVCAWNGSDFVKVSNAGGSSSFVDLTVSGNLTLSGGTANGVLYLNGSKVATSGSGLIFNGTNLGVGVSPTQAFTNSRAIQLGNGGLIEGRSNDSTTFSLASNAYLSSGGDWTYSSNNRASLFALTNGSYSFGIAAAGTGTITFTQAMTLNASGQLGIGTTNPATNLHIGTGSGTGLGVLLSRGAATNFYEAYDGTKTFIGGVDNTQSFAKVGTLSGHDLAVITGNSAKIYCVDSTGKVGIATTSPTEQLHVAGALRVTGTQTTAGTGVYLDYSSGIGNVNVYGPDTSTQGIWRVYTATSNGGTGSEKLRINNNGRFLFGRTSTRSGELSSFTGSPDDAGWTIEAINTRSSGNLNGVISYFPNSSPNNTTSSFFQGVDSAAPRFEARSNGGIANYSANNVNLSDRREKTNFAPAKSYLDVICAIPVQTFNYIDQNLEEDGGLTLGVVAQDVQAVAPELVAESNWGTKDEPKMRLSIYQTDLQYALMKCIQEQQAIIESLKARLDAANL